MSDTIFAVSSGTPPAAIAILRISGARAFAAVSALAGRVPEARRATLCALRDPASGLLLDRALVLTFPGPASATGEDLAELHLHGGRAVVRAVEAALAAQPGLRPAEAGEFTRRAVLAGRIDLTEAEGLADLLMAETEAQRRAAIGSAEGAVARAVEGWGRAVVSLAAAVEAAIDHEDEEDASDARRLAGEASAGAARLAEEIAAVTGRPTVDRLRDGIRVVLAGPPNSGKSTLFNAMVEREAAIVSPIAGTTRDRVEAPIVRNGIVWLVTDTAGLAARTDDPIEAVGIDRAREAMAAADIVLWLGDDSPPAEAMRAVAVHARSDLAGREAVPAGRVGVSATVAGGIDALWAELERRAADLLPRGDDVALNRRQRDLCCDAAESLRDAARQYDLLLMAEHLRQARLAFDRITGRADVEALFDALFSRFCIGK